MRRNILNFIYTVHLYPSYNSYPIGDTSRDLQLEDGKGTISHVIETIYLRVRITKDGNHEPEINDRINSG
jgi:hypothetical protein